MPDLNTATIAVTPEVIKTMADRRARGHAAVRYHIANNGRDLEFEDDARADLAAINYLIALDPDRLEEMMELAWYFLGDTPAEKKTFIEVTRALSECFAVYEFLAS